MTNIGQLIDRQCRRWEVERRVEQEALAKGGPARPPAVTVTISRERGCRGAAIARGLAERLDYPFFDKELIDYIAGDTEIRRRLLDMLDEKVAGGIKMWAEGMVGGRLVDRTDFVRFLTRTIRAIHEHGGAVILGRGGNCILADTSTFRVHLTAPLAARIQQVVREQACTEDEARAEINAVDADRSAFVRKSFGAEWSDPAHYDIVLNVGALDDDGAVELIESCLLRFAARRWPQAKVGGEAATVPT